MSYEIEPCRQVADGLEYSVERCEPEKAEFWGVYWRSETPKSFGLRLARWVADFCYKAEAEEYVLRVSGRSIEDWGCE